MLNAFSRITTQVLCCWFVIATFSDVHGQGIVLPGVGPVNRSMSGVATATPLDAAGAMHWNPGTLSALSSSEILFGVEFIDSQTSLSSSVGPFSGSTDSNSGIKTLPTVALVWKPTNSDWTFGLGALGIGGFGVDYAASSTNPILFPQPNGVGPLYSRLSILQIVPTASYQVTEKLSIGLAPTATIADLQLDPFFSAPPSAGGYPSAVNTRNFWGIGFQIGAYLKTDSYWNFGLSYKSPQWFETFRFNSTTGVPAVPQTLSVNTEFPPIYSLGTSYDGFEKWIFGFDMRYIDYASTGVFGDTVGYTPLGAATGLGWKSVFSFANALQYQWSKSVSLRAGYMYNQNPIPSFATSANIQSSALYTNSMSLGGSMNITQNMLAHLSWVHSFELSSTGQLLTPGGAIPGSSVSINQENDALIGGVTVKF
jgi:long-chain fatty acid transport protein